MANREALRDLQSRLAGRLQAARSEGVSVAAWLAVQAGGRDYLLPLNQAGEIFPWTGVQPVPYTQAWFLGIANLRGALMGVVDLAQLLGHGSVRNEQELMDCSLLAFNPALEQVDTKAFEKLVPTMPADVLETPQLGFPSSQAYYLAGPGPYGAQETVIEALDLPKCARSWRRVPDVGSDPAYPDLSARDADAVRYWDQTHA